MNIKQWISALFYFSPVLTYAAPPIAEHNDIIEYCLAYLDYVGSKQFPSNYDFIQSQKKKVIQGICSGLSSVWIFNPKSLEELTQSVQKFKAKAKIDFEVSDIVLQEIFSAHQQDMLINFLNYNKGYDTPYSLQNCGLAQCYYDFNGYENCVSMFPKDYTFVLLNITNHYYKSTKTNDRTLNIEHLCYKHTPTKVYLSHNCILKNNATILTNPLTILNQVYPIDVQRLETWFKTVFRNKNDNDFHKKLKPSISTTNHYKELLEIVNKLGSQSASPTFFLQCIQEYINMRSSRLIRDYCENHGNETKHIEKIISILSADDSESQNAASYYALFIQRLEYAFAAPGAYAVQLGINLDYPSKKKVGNDVGANHTVAIKKNNENSFVYYDCNLGTPFFYNSLRDLVEDSLKKYFILEEPELLGTPYTILQVCRKYTVPQNEKTLAPSREDLT